MQQWTTGPSGQPHLIILASSALESTQLCLNIGIPLFSPLSLLQLYPIQPGAENEIFYFDNASANADVIRTTVPAGGCLDVVHEG